MIYLKLHQDGCGVNYKRVERLSAGATRYLLRSETVFE